MSLSAGWMGRLESAGILLSMTSSSSRPVRLWLPKWPHYMRALVLIAALALASSASAGQDDPRRLALNAYLKCWTATYSKLHNSTGTYSAIDAANAACERQFQALAVVTNMSEAGSVMMQIMEAAKNGTLDNVRPNP